MTWTTFEHALAVCAVITTILALANTSVNAYAWYRKKRRSARREIAFNGGCDLLGWVYERQTMPPTPPPSYLPAIRPSSPITVSAIQGIQGASGEGIRLDDLDTNGHRV